MHARQVLQRRVPEESLVDVQNFAEIRDEALFKDPPAKEDCPICFLPMPAKLISCISLLPATITSVPIYDFLIAIEGESICTCFCRGCANSVEGRRLPFRPPLWQEMRMPDTCWVAWRQSPEMWNKLQVI